MAMIAMCQQFELSKSPTDLQYVETYFNLVKHCLQPEGYFLNYLDSKGSFTQQNNTSNLADINGKTIWALGYLISRKSIMPPNLIENAEIIMQQVLHKIHTLQSTRAMAFTIKGLYFYNIEKKSDEISSILKGLANRLVQMYKHESEKGWEWFESYMTYANSVLPEALLCAYAATGEHLYKDIAKTSFDFLISYTLFKDSATINSEKNWINKGADRTHKIEQPTDLTYSILALARFYEVFNGADYLLKMEKAFGWFLGDNHLQQNIYNPITGGCYHLVDNSDKNLHHGSESTISYLIARLTMEKYFTQSKSCTALENFGEHDRTLSEKNIISREQKQVA